MLCHCHIDLRLRSNGFSLLLALHCPLLNGSDISAVDV
jgi:hypothetical protein